MSALKRGRRRRHLRDRAKLAAQSLEALETRVLLAAATVDNGTSTVDAPDLSSITALNNDKGPDGTISLREAIAAANNTPGSDTLTLAQNVVLTATDNINPNENAPNGLPVIISPLTLEGGGFSISRGTSGNMRILEVGSGGNLTLNNATVSNGFLYTTANAVNGAGIYVASGATLTVNNSTITGNYTDGYGGGIYNNGTAYINNSLISNNQAHDASGGGIHNGGNLTLTASTLTNNTTARYGGGVSSSGSGALTVIRQSTFTGNIADDGGAVSAIGGANVTIENSTLSGNMADDRGGAIYLSDFGTNPTVNVNNSTITGNQLTSQFTQEGGGIFLLGGTLNLNQSLVSGNTGGTTGIELFSRNTAFNTSTVNSTNNLFGHSGLTNAQAFSSFTPSLSDITATSDGTAATALASILNTTLADNGGPTTPAGTVLTHELVIGSPAVDSSPVGLAADQVGTSRPQGLRFDAGAVESGFSRMAEAELGGTQGLLVDAINAANSDTAVAVFPAGSGADTITLIKNVSLTATDNINPNENAPNGLPVITSPLTLEGGGFSISRGTSGNMRILEVGSGGNLTLNNATVSNGFLYTTANAVNGAGIYVASGATLTVNNSTITGNYTDGYGGGIYNNGTAYINNSLISNNQAHDASGGGIHNGGNLTLTASTLTNNTTARYGGGVSSSGSGALTVIRQSTFTGNIADDGGAVSAIGGANVTIENSTLSGNMADDRGGAIYLSDFGTNPTVNVNNSTITGNQLTSSFTQEGGGIHLEGGTLNLNQSLISGNTGGTTGMEVFVSGGTLNSGSNVLGHSGLTNAQAFSAFTPALGDITATSDGTTATALAGILNTTLADNGGPTTPAGTVLTHDLVNGSPAVDAVASGLATDQRGIVRPQGTDFDHGAVELDQAPTLVSFTRLTPATSITNADTLVFRAMFNEAVMAVDTDDFAANGSTAEVTNVTGSGNSYDITLSGGDLANFNGTVGLNLSGSQNITDVTGNALPSTEPSTDETYQLDHIGPTPALTEIQFRSTYNRFTWFDQIAGTSTDPAGVASTEVGVWVRSNNRYWDGTGFNSSSPVYLATTGTPEAWALPFPFDNFHRQNFSIAVRTTDTFGNETVTSFGTQDFFFIETDLVVDQAADESDGNFLPGDLSLREAVEQANALTGPNVIRFNSSLNGTTLSINSGLAITDGVTINGPGANLLTIDGGGGTDGQIGNGDGFQLVNINDGNSGNLIDVQISGLTLTGGDGSHTPGTSGGAIRNSENLTLTNSQLLSNNARFGGGLLNSGTANVVGSTIAGNRSSQNGGGIENNGTLTLTNSTVSGNSAVGNGAGVTNFGPSGGTASVVINNTTVFGNVASGSSATNGIWNTNGYGAATATLHNSIVTDAIFNLGSLSGDHNLFGTSGATTGGANDVTGVVNPMLGPLANNGGPTQTHAVLAGSPALNAGSSTESFDQRGLARNDGNGVDIGAFEAVAPTITTGTSVNVAENTSSVVDVNAMDDRDGEGSGLVYSLSGGADQDRLQIETSTGVLTFLSSPDHENPLDIGTDNRYDVQVTATDSHGFSTSVDIAVAVTPVNDNAPTFTSPVVASVPENTQPVHTLSATDADTPSQTVGFTIAGAGADNAKFEIGSGNQLRFISAPDFENPTDLGGTAGDNIYEVSVLADDGNGLTTPQTILVTVTAVNEHAPEVTSPAIGSVSENTQSVHLLTATDADLPAQIVTFSVAGSGADNSQFQIANGNELQFINAPDFESPNDVGGTAGDNIYEVSILADDQNGMTTSQTILVTITAVNEHAPVFTSPAAASVPENTQAVHTLTTTDADLPAQNVTVTIAGSGADNAKFEIVNGNQLQFIEAPDAELPTDLGGTAGDNIYEVSVLADDQNGMTTPQTIFVTVTGVNEHAPTITSSSAVSSPENTQSVHTLTATDADVPAQTVTFSVAGSGADNMKFQIANGNELQFIIAPDFEDANDLGGTPGDNVYEVSVVADDQNGLTTPQTILVTVTDADEIAPTADIINIVPDPRNTGVGLVTIDFDETVIGVSSADFALTRNGTAVDISGLTVTQVNGSRYTIDLTTATSTDGAYVLRLNSSGSGIQDAAGNLLAVDAVDDFFIDSVAPQVDGELLVGDGSAQRSVIRELSVTFSEEVSASAASFNVLNTTTNTTYVPTVSTQLVNGKTVATLTFPNLTGGSLPDGDYELKTIAANVTDLAGSSLDGDADGSPGGDHVDTFFRYFGDVNGDRFVNIIDFGHFRNAFLFGANKEVFDFNGDGAVNIIDFGHFRSRFIAGGL